MKRQNVRTLSLIVCTFTYLLVGAAVFDALESSNEVRENNNFKLEEKKWLEAYNMTKADYKELYNLVLRMKPYKAGTQWKFAGAFYFATTVVTTIGYGHSTPKTSPGKIFCMIYATPGIPLCIVMFQSIGERMNAFITWLLKQIKKGLKFKDPSVSQTNLIIVSSNLGTIVLTAGAAAFAYYEKWDYLDAFYYCFITLTTIGFGDFVALQRNNSLAKRPDYVAFSLIFILFGLTVVSSAMNLLVLRFLTMNTMDERRDELEAAAQAQDRERLQGDVILGNGRPPSSGGPNNQLSGGVVTTHSSGPTQEDYELQSVCSCTCYDSFKPTNRRLKRGGKRLSHAGSGHALPISSVSRFHLPGRKKRYTVIREPGTVHHLADITLGQHRRSMKVMSSHQQDDTDEDVDDRDDESIETDIRTSYLDMRKKRASI